MDISFKPLKQRATLWSFIRCLIYYYHLNYRDFSIKCDAKHKDSNYIKDTIMFKSIDNIKKLIPKLAKYLSTSSKALEMSLHGSTEPHEQLIWSINALSPYKEVPARYSPHSIRGIARQAQQTLQAKYDKPTKNRISLYCFFRALVFLDGTSMSYISNEMGYDLGAFQDLVLRNKKDDEVINGLRQLPFIFHRASLKNIKAIMHGSDKPQKALIRDMNPKINNRQTLRKYIYMIASLYDSNSHKLSTKLGYSPNYLNATLIAGSGEMIMKAVTKIAHFYKLPEMLFQTAVARANVSSRYHAYHARMYFVVRYLSSPIGYHESRSESKFNRRQLFHAKYELQGGINDHNPLVTRNGIRAYIKGLGQLFNFDYNQFIVDNFVNFDNHDDNRKRTKIIDYAVSSSTLRSIMDNNDWNVILYKLYNQLERTRDTFSLPELQKSKYAPFVYVKGFGNLSYPKAENFRTELARIGNKRLHYTGIFAGTGISVVRRQDVKKEFYKPILYIKHIRHNGKIVADTVPFNYGKSFLKLQQLEPGDVLRFSARTHKYYVGDAGKHAVRKINFTLYSPSGVKLVHRKHIRVMVPMPMSQPAVTGYCIAHNHTHGYDFSFHNYGYARYCKHEYHKWQHDLKK